MKRFAVVCVGPAAMSLIGQELHTHGNPRHAAWEVSGHHDGCDPESITARGTCVDADARSGTVTLDTKSEAQRATP